MWKKNCIALLMIPISCSLVSCANREQAGALAGALTGAAVGSRIGDGSGRAAAIIFGAIIGSEIGKAIGQHMDEHDRRQTAYVLEQNKTHEYSEWRNPDTGYHFKVAPIRTYSSSSGPCREFTIDTNIGGNVEQVYGTACRQTDGSWLMQQ